MKDFNLNNEKIKPGFKVPEGYFESLGTNCCRQLWAIIMIDSRMTNNFCIFDYNLDFNTKRYIAFK